MNHGRFTAWPSFFSKTWPLLLLMLLLTGSGGCVGLLAAILHNGETKPARFSGLAEKKIAVLCVAGPSFYSENATSRQLAEQVEALIQQNTDKVTIIPQQKIDDWKDRSGWDNMDYREAGKALKAEMVVAIDLARFEIQPNTGVFKGYAEYVVSVYDIDNNGKLVFQDTPKPTEFPTNGVSLNSGSDRQFRSAFMQLLAHRIARNFYKYSAHQDLMLDESFVAP